MRRALLVVTMALVAAIVPADDAVLQVLTGAQSDPRLADVLYFAIGVELNRAGLDSLRARLDDPETELTYQHVARMARRQNADLVLLVRYRREGDLVEIELSLYADGSSDPRATGAVTSPVDIDLDSRVATAVRDLVRDAGIEPDRSETASIEGFDLAPTAGQTQQMPLVAGAEISVMTTGVFVVGPATDYFRYGIAGTLSGGYAPASERVGATFGARASFVRMFTGEAVEGGDLYLVTAGPEALVGTPFRAPARIGARASGGAAVLIVARSAETLAKTVPYAEAGIGARLPLGSRFAVGLEINYLVVFEPGYPLMGFAPAVSVSMEP